MSTSWIAAADVYADAGVRVNIDDIISYIEWTQESTWTVGVVRTADGAGDCFFGHLHRLGALRAMTQLREGALRLSAQERHLTEPEVVANRLWEWFEEHWATTYRVYGVNDGTDPRYWQGTPRRRVLSFLRALRDGDDLRTQASLDADAAAFTARA